MSKQKENELVYLNENVSNEVDDDDDDDDDDDEQIGLLPRRPVPVVKDEDDLLLEASFLDDIFAVLNEAKFIAPLLALAVLILGIYWASDPFSTGSPRPKRLTPEEFKEVRPVLTIKEMADIYVSTMYAETQFKLPEPWYDNIAMKFSTVVDRHGHHQPPEIFFGGVIYGISATNGHGIDFSESRRRLQSESELDDELREILEGMTPKPTAIFDRFAQNNETLFKDRGLAVYFSLQDLEKQGMLSSDEYEPWKRTLDPILKVARDFRQVYITQWYPRKFGRQDVEAVAKNPHRHETVVRQIIPTRTGLNNIKSTAVVWLMWTNFTSPTIPDTAIQKPWTDSDHWTHYS